MKISSLFSILSIMLFLHACKTPECNNSNPVFDRFTYETEAYKRELAKQLLQAGPETLGYTFDDYVEKNGNAFIVVNIQGDGYRSAALEGLEIETVQDSAQIQFVYKGIDRIVD